MQIENIEDNTEPISKPNQLVADKLANTKLETLPDRDEISGEKLAVPIIGNKIWSDPNSYKQAISSAKALLQPKAMEKEIANLNR